MGSVVTYLLVALQFQWPTKMENQPEMSQGNEVFRTGL